jgi:hypothetical protein
MILVSDGGTSLKFPLFLNNKRKETTLDAFKVWLVEVEVQTGKCLKCVRIDLGREFDNELFLGFCVEWGIYVEKIPKDSLSTNGHVEQGNRTVVEGTCTQLIDVSLDHCFWAEHIATCTVSSLHLATLMLYHGLCGFTRKTPTGTL